MQHVDGDFGRDSRHVTNIKTILNRTRTIKCHTIIVTIGTCWKLNIIIYILCFTRVYCVIREIISCFQYDLLSVLMGGCLTSFVVHLFVNSAASISPQITMVGILKSLSSRTFPKRTFYFIKSMVNLFISYQIWEWWENTALAVLVASSLTSPNSPIILAMNFIRLHTKIWCFL